MPKDIRLLLDNVRSVHNTGSIFRTAETLGIKKIYCAGTTPTPLDRFGRKRKDFAKVSLGAEDSVQWEHIDDPVRLIKRLNNSKSQTTDFEFNTDTSPPYKGGDGQSASWRTRGDLTQNKKRKSNEWTIIALEQSKNSIDYKKAKVKGNTLIVLGNEVDGVSQGLLNLSDTIAEIPLQGKKESLNVSVAAGIFLYRLLDK